MSTDDFALRLAVFREQAGFSQRELAELTGLPLLAIAGLEASETMPSWAEVELIARALGRSWVSFADPSLKLPAKKTQKRQ